MKKLLTISFLLLTVTSASGQPTRVSPRRAEGMLTACGFNTKNIATALEMYATDHNDKYPKSLKELVGPYLKSIPRCPSAEADTYSASYMSEMRREGHSKPESHYKFCCSGDHHHGLTSPNHPAYDSKAGFER